MQKRTLWITAPVLIGVLVASVACTLSAATRQKPPPDDAPLSAPALLWQFEGADVVEVTVTKEGRTTAVVRSGPEWHMTAPSAGAADSARLNSLVAKVAGMTFSRAIDDVQDLAAFGLQRPEARVTLVLDDGTTIRADIGAEDPSRTARYVHKQGDPFVYLVPIGDLQELLGLVDEPPYSPPPLPPQPSPLETPAFLSPLSPLQTPAAASPTATPEPPAQTPTPKATLPPRPTLGPSS